MNKGMLLIAVISFLVYACDEADSSTVLDSSTECVDATCVTDNSLNDTIVAEVDSAYTEGLLYLREEEKLARDVYMFLYDKWGTKVFNNIMQSEQKHTDAVLSLLDLYGIDDIVGDNPPGVFENEELQALYNSLIERGEMSEVEALKVGALIEEVDIIDLAHEMEHLTDETIYTVYNNLLNGSYNHLNAFVRNLGQRGVDYSPQLLSDEAYSQIVN